MGLIVDKAKIVGLFGGFQVSKAGKFFLSIVSPGPKIDKIQLDMALAVPDGCVFGSRVEVLLNSCEQKFMDFNGSYSVAVSAVLQAAK